MGKYTEKLRDTQADGSTVFGCAPDDDNIVV